MASPPAGLRLAIGLTALFGFPGTMILSQEAAKGGRRVTRGGQGDRRLDPARDDPAGFAPVTVTSVIVTSIIAGRIGG